MTNNKKLVKSKFVFVTFIYPGIEKYFKFLVNSINSQTDSDFDILIHNDGLKDFDNLINSIKGNVNVYRSQANNIFDIRIKTFNECKNLGYKYIIVGDSDDGFGCNRFEQIKVLFKKFDLVVNDLTLIDDNDNIIKEKVFSKRINNESSFQLDDIKDYNFIGFTNSAFSVDIIPEIVIRPNPMVVAVDWYFYSLMLKSPIKSVFTSNTVSYYRNHENNIAGLRSDYLLDKRNRDKYAIVRKLHYKAIQKLNLEITDNQSKIKKNRSINFWWEIQL